MNTRSAMRIAALLTTYRIAGMVGVAALAAVLSATLAQATSNHAHWHYLIGARANFARSFATQLHHEAIAPGTLHLEPARVNAVDLGRLAEEIIARVDELQRVSSERENDLIREHANLMRATAEHAAAVSKELLDAIDRELAAGRTEIVSESPGTGAAQGEANMVPVSGAATPPGDLVRSEIAARAAALFHQFGVVLKAHKDAEHLLGIFPPNPVP